MTLLPPMDGDKPAGVRNRGTHPEPYTDGTPSPPPLLAFLLAAAIGVAASCATFETSDEGPPIVGADRARLLDAAHAAFTEIFGGATRDDRAGRIVHAGAEPWLTGYAIVRAEAQVSADPEGFRLAVRCRRLFVEDDQRARMGRSFAELESGLGEGEAAPELAQRLVEAARAWLSRGEADEDSSSSHP